MGDDERLSAVADELGLLLDELRSLAANRSAGVHRKGVTNLTCHRTGWKGHRRP